jgi:hypothetical protein
MRDDLKERAVGFGWCVALFAGLVVWGVARRLRGERADYWFPGRGARR